MYMYKSMSYKQLSIEAYRLLAQGWFKNFDKIKVIHNEMQLRRTLENAKEQTTSAR